MSTFTGTVAITGLNATDNPGPGVAVAMCLRADPRFQGRIVGLAYDVLDPGLYAQGLLDASYLIPYPSTGRQALFSRLAHIKEEVGLDVLIPNLDSELPSLVDQEEALEAMGIRTYLPTRVQLDARAKENLDDLRKDHGVAVPLAESFVAVGTLHTLHERFTFPVVVKSPFYGAKICYSVDEAVRAFHALAAKWGIPIIVQSFVAGEELNVCAVGDGEGGMIGAVAMKKMLLTDTGKGWAGVAIHDDKLMGLARDVIAATRWRGPCEVEAIRDASGETWLLEVNPRFPAWCDLTGGAGQNLPLAVARLAMGETVEPMTDFRAGAAFVRISINQIIDISAMSALSIDGQNLPVADKRSA